MPTLDKTWHLAQNPIEVDLINVELRLWRTYFGFVRWQEECEQNTNSTDLSASDLSVLHIIRMKNKPKSPGDICRYLNRDDRHNVLYSIRKLEEQGFIKPAKNHTGKEKAYDITEVGLENTEAYTLSRKSILVDLFVKSSDIDLKSLAQLLAKLEVVYQEAAITITTCETKK